jgi:tetratricopeptide (TPR) repeat protein
MSPFTSITRLAPLALAFATTPLMAENAAPAAPAAPAATKPAAPSAPAQLVFQNGRSIPLSSVDIAQDKVLIKTAADGFDAGQSFPLTAVSHVFGDRPAELNQAIALLLFDRHKEAIDLLEPLLAAHRVSAKIPGNFWIESARTLLVCFALTGDAARCTQLGKDISDATPPQGGDPFVSLGKALLMPASVSPEDRDMSLKDLTADEMPADVAAYASFYRSRLFKEQKKNAEALQALLAVPCLYPSGGLILNAAAEILASDLLASLSRRDEATHLINSALRVSQGTILIEEGNKRLESM